MQAVKEGLFKEKVLLPFIPSKPLQLQFHWSCVKVLLSIDYLFETLANGVLVFIGPVRVNDFSFLISMQVGMKTD